MTCNIFNTSVLEAHSSHHKGVGWSKRDQKWRARFKFDGQGCNRGFRSARPRFGAYFRPSYLLRRVGWRHNITKNIQKHTKPIQKHKDNYSKHELKTLVASSCSKVISIAIPKWNLDLWKCKYYHQSFRITFLGSSVYFLVEFLELHRRFVNLTTARR